MVHHNRFSSRVGHAAIALGFTSPVEKWKLPWWQAPSKMQKGFSGQREIKQMKGFSSFLSSTEIGSYQILTWSRVGSPVVLPVVTGTPSEWFVSAI
jgi:hypothetical protein